jgi:branched-chain amino acid transport system substrate-binding protein
MVKPVRVVAAVAVASLALSACGGGSSGSGTGSGGKTLTISTDTPLQGSAKDASESTNNAIKLYLEQLGNKAGNFTIELKTYDDSTAAKGSWDDATCAKNAKDHVANPSEVAVMGTFNSGCAKIQAPVLNQDPNGPMVMISHANTNPGLTKAWEPGEPEKYFPTGKRSYGRVVTTDDNQGAAAAAFAAQDLGLKNCVVLNDNQTYGQGVAKAFADSAKTLGINVIANQPWDVKQPSYQALFQGFKAKNPDCFFFGGIYDQNGAQLVKDKVAIFGDNTKVKVIAPDGFTGYPDLLKQPEAEGIYLTFPGLALDTLKQEAPTAAKFLADYKTKYGKDPDSNYAIYGVAAVQVILAAIEKSDGTRKGVRDAIFEGTGITIPASESVLGKDLSIDPATGDVSVKDMTVELIKGGKETFVKVQPVG